jgi:exonuclease VII large subunit
MTPQDVKAMEAARREFHDAVKAFDATVQKRNSKAEIAEALNTMNEKQTAYHAFGEKFFNNYPQAPRLW